jgi:hypothetical protein
MAVTNGWGQAAINNTNGYGKGAINATNDWGEVYADSSSGDTNIGVSAAPSFTNTYSLNFDGVDDVVAMGDVLDMANDGTDAFSISVWFKTTSSATYQEVVAKQDGGGWYNGYAIYIKSGTEFRFFLGTIQGSEYIMGKSTIATLNDGNWHHMVVTYDGSQARAGFQVYHNGSAISNSNLRDVTPTDVANSADFMIGARGTGGSPALYFDGNIDETSYFTSELSSSDVTSIYNSGVPNDISSLSPVGWWRMGEEGTWSGGREWILTDQGSGGNDGTSVNMVEASRETDVPT